MLQNNPNSEDLRAAEEHLIHIPHLSEVCVNADGTPCVYMVLFDV